MSDEKSESLRLTAAESALIRQMRETADQHNWIVPGIFVAAEYLEGLGRECAGGDGDAKNPETGMRYGEPYFAHAQMLRQHGAKLGANPPKITAPVLSIAALTHEANPHD